jgi:hypothetical protein
MAQVPTPEESGLKILALYRQDNLRAGEMMLIQSLRARWLAADLREADLQTGLEWLLEQDYLKPNQGRMMFWLTDAGFAAM